MCSFIAAHVGGETIVLISFPSLYVCLILFPEISIGHVSYRMFEFCCSIFLASSSRGIFFLSTINIFGNFK